MKTPAWEKRQLPPWELSHVPNHWRDNDHRRRNRSARVIYVPYAVAYEPEPQVIVVQQPPATRVVRVESPAAAEPPADTPPPAVEPPPPYVPTGDRTVYVIPGCYVGNVSPINMKLPATCDITKLTTYVP